jgi:hypothetical protein
MEGEEEKQEIANPGWRTCEACGEPKKMASFRKSKTGEGHDYVCKGCQQKIAKNRRLERLETQACKSFLAKARGGGSEIPHTSEMLESIMSLFGGSHGFAAMLSHQYHSAPPGGRIRNQVLEMIVRLTGKVAESGATRAPVSLMSDEELEAEIEKRMENAVLSFKGQRIIGIEKEEIPDGGRLAGVEVDDRRFA